MEPTDNRLQPNLLDFQNKPRRKNAMSYEECLEVEQKIKINSQDNVANKSMITGFSQLNINNKVVKK